MTVGEHYKLGHFHEILQEESATFLFSLNRQSHFSLRWFGTKKIIYRSYLFFDFLIRRCVL